MDGKGLSNRNLEIRRVRQVCAIFIIAPWKEQPSDRLLALIVLFGQRLERKNSGRLQDFADHSD
jgi:hypothetical protein